MLSGMGIASNSTGLHATPLTLSQALMDRREELRDVKVGTIGPMFNWDQPGADQAFTIEATYLGTTTRPLMNEGRMDFYSSHVFPTRRITPRDGLRCVYDPSVCPGQARLL